MASYALYNGIRYRVDGQRMVKDIGNTTSLWGIPAPPQQPTAANGAGAGDMVKGDYQIHIVGVSRYSKKGDVHPDGAVTVTLPASSASIDITAIPIWTRPFDDIENEVTHVNIYRTLKDSVGPFYYAGQVVNGTTIITLNGNDDSLPLTDFLEPPYIYEDAATEMAGPFRYPRPITKTQVATYDGRIFAMGESASSPGYLSATSGSAVMTGSAIMTDAMIGKYVYIDGESVGYQIASIQVAGDEVTDASWTTTAAYYHPLNGEDPVGAAFIVIGNPNEIVFSEQTQPEYFPAVNQILVDNDDGDVITTAITHNQELLIFTDKTIQLMHRTNSIANPYGMKETMSRYGTIAPRSVVDIGGAVMFYTGEHICIYRNGQSAIVSDPIKPMLDAIPEDRRHEVVGEFFDGRVYFGIPYDDAYYQADYVDKIPVLDTILVYAHPQSREAYWDFPMDSFTIVDMAVLSIASGTSRLCIMQPTAYDYGIFYFDDEALTDGAGNSGYTGTATVASYVSEIYDPSLPWIGEDEIAGRPIYITAGTNVGERTVCKSSGPGFMRIYPPLPVRPDATTEYVVGGINCEYYSRVETSGNPHTEKTFMEIEIGMEE